MKKYILMLFCVALAFSCGRGGRAGAESNNEPRVHTESGTHDHGDHEGHDHEGHSHEGHSHEGHSHAADAHEGCDHGDHEGHDHSGDGHAANPDEIIFPASQAAKIDFKVEEVVASTFNEVIKASGRIMPAQGQEVTLSAPVSGIVSFAGANLAEGNSVGQSQNLFYVSSKNIATGDVTAKNEAAYRKAKADYERARLLLADKIVSQREFDAIEAEYTQARTDYEALSGAQSERGTGVSSPISGYVTSLRVTGGDFVEMGQTLASVSQNRRLMLRAEVSQRYYAQLGNLRGANFITPSDNRTHRLADMGGRLISTGRSTGAAMHMIPVTFEFDNNGAVVPGSYVEVYLLGAPVANAITLPVTAITEQQGIHYVYVQLDEEGYERRQVTLGGSDSSRVRILSGVAEGERVVTRGAVNVKLSSASGAIPHGHEH